MDTSQHPITVPSTRSKGSTTAMQFSTQVIATVADSQNVTPEEVATVITDALQAAYDTTPNTTPATVTLDRGTGDIRITDHDGNPVTLAGFTTRAANAARQAITAWTRDVERRRKVGPWGAREGTAVTARVTGRTTDGAYRLHIEPGVEAILPSGEQITDETHEPGDTITTLLLNANTTDRGAIRLTVSRRQPTLITAIIDAELKRTGSATRTVKIARAPGRRSKVTIAGEGATPSPELIAALRTASQAVTPERIDILPAGQGREATALAALTPAQGAKLLASSDTSLVVIAVPADQLAAARGADGTNLRLAAKLANAKIRLVAV